MLAILAIWQVGKLIYQNLFYKMSRPSLLTQELEKAQNSATFTPTENIAPIAKTQVLSEDLHELNDVITTEDMKKALQEQDLTTLLDTIDQYAANLVLSISKPEREDLEEQKKSAAKLLKGTFANFNIKVSGPILALVEKKVGKFDAMLTESRESGLPNIDGILKPYYYKAAEILLGKITMHIDQKGCSTTKTIVSDLKQQIIEPYNQTSAPLNIKRAISDLIYDDLFEIKIIPQNSPKTPLVNSPVNPQENFL